MLYKLLLPQFDEDVDRPPDEPNVLVQGQWMNEDIPVGLKNQLEALHAGT